MSPSAPEPLAAPAPPPPGEQELARAALTYLAEPGDPALGALLEICEPAEILTAIRADLLPGIGPGCGDRPATRKALERALGCWRARLSGLPDDSGLAKAGRHGIRLVCPTDPEWPAGLNELGQARPYALWVRGRADLRAACARSVAMVGCRAASGYGAHVAGEIAGDLGERGWTIVSGGDVVLCTASVLPPTLLHEVRPYRGGVDGLLSLWSCWCARG